MCDHSVAVRFSPERTTTEHSTKTFDGQQRGMSLTESPQLPNRGSSLAARSKFAREI